MMKTKKFFSFLFFLYAISLAAFFSSCSKTETIYGYIPVGETMQEQWTKMSPSLIWNFVLTRYIKVIADNGDTISAVVPATFSGKKSLVEYRDSYPLCKDKKVFVRMTKDDDDIYWIKNVALESLVQ